MWRVSTVLALNGLSQSHKALDDFYRERGHAIHSAAEAMAMGHQPLVDPAHAGYITALRLWYQKFAPIVISTERRIVNRILRLTGRIDMVAIVDDEVFIIDIKTGSPALWHKWQLALYAVLACEDTALMERVRAVAPSTKALTPLTIGRAVLYLSENGRPKFEIHRDPQDHYIARSALTLVQVRHEAGLLDVTDPEQPDDDVVAVQAGIDTPF